MPDISKCNGLSCGERDKCYRFTAPANEHQSWLMSFYPDAMCEYFMPIRDAAESAEMSREEERGA